MYPFFPFYKRNKKRPFCSFLFPLVPWFFLFRTLFSLSSPWSTVPSMRRMICIHIFYSFCYAFEFLRCMGVDDVFAAFLYEVLIFYFLSLHLPRVGFSIKVVIYGQMVQWAWGAGNVFICNLMSLRLGTTKRWYGACDTRIEKSPLDNQCFLKRLY